MEPANGAKVAVKAHIAVACRACGGSGSVATVAVRHAQELSRQFNVTLLSDSFSGPPQEVDHAVVAHHRFDYLRRFGHMPTECAFVRAVRRRLEALQAVRSIDLVICHSHTLATLAARYLKAKYQIPYAVVVHGDIFERPRGTYDPWLTALYKVVTPPAYKEADLVLAVSPHVARCAIARGARPEAVVVVPNGIDRREIGFTETPLPTSHRARGGRINVLYVGRYSVEKGVRFLVCAGSLLRAKGVDFELRLVGQGPLESELRQAVLKLGLSLDVTFVGQVDRSALGHHYDWADIVCVPSLSDSLPAVVLEALVAGRPVVGTDVGGIPWMVKSGATGMIIRAGSPEALAEAIRELACDPTRRQEMGVEAAASVFPRFSWAAIGEQVRDAVGRTIRRAPRQATRDPDSVSSASRHSDAR